MVPSLINIVASLYIGFSKNIGHLSQNILPRISLNVPRGVQWHIHGRIAVLVFVNLSCLTDLKSCSAHPRCLSSLQKVSQGRILGRIRPGDSLLRKPNWTPLRRSDGSKMGWFESSLKISDMNPMSGRLSDNSLCNVKTTLAASTAHWHITVTHSLGHKFPTLWLIGGDRKVLRRRL